MSVMSFAHWLCENEVLKKVKGQHYVLCFVDNEIKVKDESVNCLKHTEHIMIDKSI